MKDKKINWVKDPVKDAVKPKLSSCDIETCKIHCINHEDSFVSAESTCSLNSVKK